MDPPMEAANPLFGANAQGHISQDDRDTFPLAQKSTKSLKPIPADTTLNQADWEMIEDDLLPFECTAILISLGGISLIGLTIHGLVTNAQNLDIGVELLNGMNAGPILTFVMVVPCIIGSVQILLAGFFSMLAALESWQHVSIQDVIRHHLPDKAENCAKRIPLTCTARKGYLALMWIFLLIQFVASAVAYGVNATLEDETNKGADSLGSTPIIHEILDYSAAVFNVCCAERGWSKQGFIPPCPPGTTTIQNCTVPPDQISLQSRLCTCYSISQEQYLKYERYVNESRVCNITTKALIPIPTGQKIPGTSISIRTLIPPNIDQIPIIGDMNTVYGCGTGFVRGFQWTAAQWSTNNLEPYFLAMLCISGLQILFLLVGSTVVCRLKVTATPRVGEDGNLEYGEAAPLRVPQGIRGLLKSPMSPTPTSILSPKLLMPRFRGRSRSGSGIKSPRVGTPGKLDLASSPTLEQQMAMGVSSPELMKKAAQRSSTAKDVPPQLPLTTQANHTSSGTNSNSVDIDRVL